MSLCVATPASTSYQWDHRNRLVKVTQQGTFGTDTRLLTYEYDVFDRRVVSHTLSLSTGQPARSTYWVWDGEQMALQFNDGDGGGPSAATVSNVSKRRVLSPYPGAVPATTDPK
jgi:hypothetical protein